MNNLHPIVKLTQNAFSQGHTNHRGQLYYGFAGTLDVRVTPSCLNRALRIYETIFRECEKRKITIKLDNYNRTMICFNDVEITIRVRERIQRRLESEKQQWSFGFNSYAPTGILVLEIDETSDDGSIRKNFKDSAKKKVEDQLNEFFISVYKFSYILRLRKEKRDKEHEKYLLLIEEQKRKELEIQREKEQIAKLKNDVLNWDESQKIIAYIDAVESKYAKEDITPEERKKLHDWIKWAKTVADKSCLLNIIDNE